MIFTPKKLDKSVFSETFCKVFLNAVTSQNLRLNEVNLFRALQKSLTGMSNKFAIEEYHGNSKQVTFKGYQAGLSRCELADLMILTYSKMQKKIRMTFLQAKFERKKVQSPQTHQYSINSKQLFLLKNKPKIEGCRGFKPPKDLLSSALLETVGTFLFFYSHFACRTTPKIEMFFCSAKRLEWPRNQTKSHRSKTHCKMPKSTTGKSEECLMAENMRKFAENLYQLKIGTPLSLYPNDKSTKWVASVLKSIATANPQKALAKELLDLISNGQADDISQQSIGFGAKNLIIINTDRTKNHSSYGTEKITRSRSLCHSKSQTA